MQQLYAGNMGTLYDIDIVAWSVEQADLLRAGRFSELDVDNIVEEIEAVGRSEKRELESRLAVLIAHLLKWQLQPHRRTGSWLRTIKIQRTRIERLLCQTPSLKPMLDDQEFLVDAWLEAAGIVTREAGLDDVPLSPIWPMTEILALSFLP